MRDDLIATVKALQKCIEDRNVEGAGKLLDDEFALELVHGRRAVIPRERWLDVLKDYVIHSYEVEEQIVDSAEDVGAALHRARMNATVLGQDRTGVFIISDVWRLRDGSWRLWRRHSTPLSSGELPTRTQVVERA